MNIGIIGAGNIGGNLTRRLTALGHNVSVANSRGPESLWHSRTKPARNLSPFTEAVQNKDLIIVTIPEKNIPNLPKGLFGNLGPNVVVMDTGNYYPQQRDGRIAGIEDGLTESGWVEQQLGHPVIKAFNNIYAAHLLAMANRKARPDALRCPLPAMMQKPRRS